MTAIPAVASPVNRSVQAIQVTLDNLADLATWTGGQVITEADWSWDQDNWIDPTTGLTLPLAAFRGFMGAQVPSSDQSATFSYIGFLDQVTQDYMPGGLSLVNTGWWIIQNDWGFTCMSDAEFRYMYSVSS